MLHAPLIIFSDPALTARAAAYERELAGKVLSEKLIECQTISDADDELSMAKALLLYALGGEEVAHEVRRVFSWDHREPKANFVVLQLQSGDPLLMLCSVELLGVLKERLASPALASIFDVRHKELAVRIVRSLSAIGGSIAVGTILKALLAKDAELVKLSVEELAPLFEDVPWTVFRPLLTHADPSVRCEAAFAICVRRSIKSAPHLLKALERETDRTARRELIHDLGIVPSTRFLLPLLRIIVHDDDQKARLMATRALDRLQGIVHSGALFRLRNLKDVRIRAEVLSRLGKFGSDIEAHKTYLRSELQKSEDVHIIQACLQALGNIAERDDRDLLRSFLGRDPVVAYAAALSLIRVVRLEDADFLMEVLGESNAPTLRQVFLKYLIRRRGFSTDAQTLLALAKSVIEGERNINVRYLTFILLRFAPCADTVAYLLLSLATVENAFERDALEATLCELVRHHPKVVLAFLAACDESQFRIIIRYVPEDLSPSFYHSMAELIFKRCAEECEEGTMQGHVRDMVELIVESPVAVHEFLQVVPDDRFAIVSVLQALVEHADRHAIEVLKDDLVDLLAHEDAEIRALALMLVLSLKDRTMLPHIITIAESDPREEIQKTARYISKILIAEGVL